MIPDIGISGGNQERQEDEIGKCDRRRSHLALDFERIFIGAIYFLLRNRESDHESEKPVVAAEGGEKEGESGADNQGGQDRGQEVFHHGLTVLRKKKGSRGRGLRPVWDYVPEGSEGPSYDQLIAEGIEQRAEGREQRAKSKGHD